MRKQKFILWQIWGGTANGPHPHFISLVILVTAHTSDDSHVSLSNGEETRAPEIKWKSTKYLLRTWMELLSRSCAWAAYLHNVPYDSRCQSRKIHFGHMGCLHEIIRRLLGVAWWLFLRNPWESALGWWPVPGVYFPWPKVSWDRLQLTRYPNKDIIRTETVFLERKYSAWWNGLIQNIFLHPWIQHSLDKSRPRLEVIVSFNVESKSNIFSLQEYVICEKKILFHKHTCLPLLCANSQGWQLTPYCPFFAHEYGDGIRLLLSEGANLF